MTTTLDVSGRGTASQRPDMATLSVTVITKSVEDVYTAAPAAEENSKIMNAVLNTLDDFGVAKEDIKTAVFQVYPEFDGGREFKGFSATNGVDIKLRDMDKVGRLCAVLLENRAVKLGTPQFKLENPKVLEFKAREIAFSRAKEKAEQLAILAGLELVGVAAITDGHLSHSLTRQSNHKQVKFEGYPGISGYSGFSGASGFSGYVQPPIFEQDELMTLDVAVTFIAKHI